MTGTFSSSVRMSKNGRYSRWLQVENYWDTFLTDYEGLNFETHSLFCLEEEGEGTLNQVHDKMKLTFA